ncbi:GTP-binding protein Rho1 [Halocaridina rubra]|uniref:GTP-binding protein Rho1 n=1 Tax=Halocaridina rubra TaxID=373956 RepID=A0AAN8X8W3_HALRR
MRKKGCSRGIIFYGSPYISPRVSCYGWKCALNCVKNQGQCSAPNIKISLIVGQCTWKCVKNLSSRVAQCTQNSSLFPRAEMSEEAVSLSIKMVVVGDCSVGKTSLLMNYLKGTFPKAYVPTVHETHPSCYSDGENDFHITFWDTSGDNQYSRVRCLSYSEATVFLVCFSVVQRDSLLHVTSKWLPEIRKHCGKAVPIVLLGTKTDLRTDVNVGLTRHSKKMMHVAKEEGVSLAQKEMMSAYVECSIMNFQACHEVIKMATEAAKTYQKPQSEGICCILL